MADKITYTNKEYLINDETIPDKNKVLDTDLNEIKEVVNNNADELDTATANIEELQETVESQGSAIDELQEDNTTNKANIQENTTDISNIKTEQTTQDTRISDLETDNETNKSNISTNTQNIATLQADSGHTLDLELNSSTYVLTLTLKNKSGTVLSTKTVDLPLETMVVNGSYNNTTKKVVLTLQNGNTVEFSVADLVDGLQNEITNENKLSSDLVDDTNKTHKFMTQSEKSKLEGIETEANKTIVDTELNGTSTNPVQNKMVKAEIERLEIEHKRILNQIPEGTAEGIFITLNDSSDLDFVDIVTEGSLSPDTKVNVVTKNFLEVSTTSETVNGLTITRNADKSVTIDGTASANTNIVFTEEPFVLPAGTYTYSMEGKQKNKQNMQWFAEDSTYNNTISLSSTNNYRTVTYEEDVTINRVITYVTNGSLFDNVTIYPMIEKGSSMTSYKPHEKQTKLLSSGQEELRKLHTYKNITNIFTVTEGTNPTLNVTYKKDLETILNNLNDRLTLVEG